MFFSSKINKLLFNIKKNIIVNKKLFIPPEIKNVTKALEITP